MFKVSREFRFESAHRIVGHSGKCKHLHGHSYRAVVVVESSDVDKMGMVVDFGKIKELVGRWIDDSWDHNTILQKDDKLGSLIIQDPLSRKLPYFCENNPTAENLARELFDVAFDMLYDAIGNINVISVTIWETENSSATYTKGI